MTQYYKIETNLHIPNCPFCGHTPTHDPYNFEEFVTHLRVNDCCLSGQDINIDKWVKRCKSNDGDEWNYVIKKEYPLSKQPNKVVYVAPDVRDWCDQLKFGNFYRGMQNDEQSLVKYLRADLFPKRPNNAEVIKALEDLKECERLWGSYCYKALRNSTTNLIRRALARYDSRVKK